MPSGDSKETALPTSGGCPGTARRRAMRAVERTLDLKVRDLCVGVVEGTGACGSTMLDSSESLVYNTSPCGCSWPVLVLEMSSSSDAFSGWFSVIMRLAYCCV